MSLDHFLQIKEDLKPKILELKDWVFSSHRALQLLGASVYEQVF